MLLFNWMHLLSTVLSVLVQDSISFLLMFCWEMHTRSLVKIICALIVKMWMSRSIFIFKMKISVDITYPGIHSGLIGLKTRIYWLGKISLVTMVEGRFYTVKQFKKEENTGSITLFLSFLVLLQEWTESCKKVVIACRLYLWWPLRNKSAVVPYARLQIAEALPQLTHTCPADAIV